MKRGPCDDCGKHDLLGFVACIERHLCPECAGAFLGADPDLIRADLEAKVKKLLAENLDGGPGVE